MADEPPSGDQWLYEVKFDGYRIQTHIEKEKVELYSRSGLEWTSRFPTIAQALTRLDVRNIIIDGEVVWLDEKGRSDFQKMQNSLKEKDSRRLVYYAFDLLFFNGEDYRSRPLVERKYRLEKIIKSLNDPLVRYSEHFLEDPISLFETVCSYGLEGLVSKDRDSIYQSKRTSAWVKVKCKKQQEFVIGGYTSGKGARSAFGALLLGAYEGNKLRYVGRVGTGFTEKSLTEVLNKLKRKERTKSPFDLSSPKGKGLHWLKPEFVAEVTFANWTSDNILRTPVFMGLREDKPPKSIIIEKEKPLEDLRIIEDQVESQNTNIKTNRNKNKNKNKKESLPISNPEKVFFKQERITKLQVAQYYQDFSNFILPHISDRPLALYRCPEGTSGECFFQKRVPDPVPANLIPLKIRDGDELKEFLSINSKEGLLALSQMGAFELHAWGCHTDHIENPDQVVMDFDPGSGVGWEQVVKSARELKKILEVLNLDSYVKLTGGKGLHVHIPVAPIYSWDQIKNFAKTLGREMVLRNKELYTISPLTHVRGKKIYIDYLRNGRGATAVAPYCLRARHISSIAMPVSWNELAEIERSDQFTLDKAYDYLKNRKIDPWKNYFRKQQRISILKPVVKTS
ncbi:MAG: DNA ligase D [Bdellovibrio sp.]